MAFQTNVTLDVHEQADIVTNSWRPYGFNRDGLPVNKQGRVLVKERDLAANAFLNREEWERLDAAILARARLRLNAWGDVVAAGATTRTTLAEWSSKWRVASEVTAAEVTMDFESHVEEDRTDKKTYSVPIPIISKRFSIGRRELLTARALGTDIETFEGEEAGQAVAEMAEYILINGETGVAVQATTIPGYRTLSALTSGTAEGDFGTLSNIYETFRLAVAAQEALRYYGPFTVYMHNTQYSEMLQYYSDGSGQRGLDRVLAHPRISAVKPNDLCTAGEIIMVQLDRSVVDLRIALDMEVRRYESPDGSRMHFIVLMAAVPRLKTDYAGTAGILLYTGA